MSEEAVVAYFNVLYHGFSGTKENYVKPQS